MFARIDVLKRHYKFNPRVIFDIGAHTGKWTEQCKTIYPAATYYQFEANTDKLPHLLDNPTICLLGNEDGKIVTYYKDTTVEATGNSIFREKSIYFDDGVCEKEERLMKRLDTIVHEKEIPLPDFIKLDVQGAELLILEGAPACLCSADIVMLEASIASLNEGSPLIYDVLKFMDTHGFVLFDIADLSYIGPVLAQVDILFCKKGSRYHTKDFHWAIAKKSV